MSDPVVDPIQRPSGQLESNGDAHKPEPVNSAQVEDLGLNNNDDSSNKNNNNNTNDVVVVSSKSSKNGKNSGSANNVVVRRERPTRACTARPPKYVDPPVIERRSRPPKRVKVEKHVEDEENDDNSGGEEENEVKGHCSTTKVVTSLVNPPTVEQMPRWSLRSMWELASILHFFHVFRPLLNITVEFSAEELESALLTPNGTLGDVHIPLLKSIPPVTRMACGRETWVTVLCRKLRDWWQWVAEGELPIVSAQGAEIETYKNLDPAVRVVILKALCDIRVEQDDIRSYIDNSLKHGVQLSAFRKHRIGGDSHGISYWYEDDEEIGHRLYREIRKVEKIPEPKRGKTKGSNTLPSITYEWETVATNLDEFLDVSEKLFTSNNRTEASVGKKLKNDMIPEIEKIHKRKEKLLKKQHRQALLLDSFVTMDGLGGGGGRSLRDRKPVTYTFDDFDRSINEAIKVTKRKQLSPEHGSRRELMRSEHSANGRINDPSHASMHVSFSPASPADYDEMDEDHKSGPLDRSSRRRQKSQRYSGKEFVGDLSENEEYVDSDDDIVGEAVYHDDYLKNRKQMKGTSSSEGGDEEYHWSDDNAEEEVEEEEDDDDDSLSGSEDSDQPRNRFKETRGRARQGTGRRSFDAIGAGLRRSKRSTRTRINYQQYEYSESETESSKRRRTKPSDDLPNYSTGTQDSDEGNDEEGNEEDHPGTEFEQSIPTAIEKDEAQPSQKSESPTQDEPDGVGERRFLDLNELAPGSGFDDGPTTLVKDDNEKGE